MLGVKPPEWLRDIAHDFSFSVYMNIQENNCTHKISHSFRETQALAQAQKHKAV